MTHFSAFSPSSPKKVVLHHTSSTFFPMPNIPVEAETTTLCCVASVSQVRHDAREREQHTTTLDREKN